MNRKHLIAGLAALALLCILNMAGIGNLLMRELNKPSPAGKRGLVMELTYCSANDTKPCIVSFSLDTGDNTLLVNILTPASSYPDFYLKISNASEENIYECQQVEDFPTNVYCTGKEMHPGEPLHFAIISRSNERVMAAGDFAIIGLLLVTPSAPSTETVAPTNEFSETSTPFLLNTPTPPTVITDSTPTVPSYPNPSYP